MQLSRRALLGLGAALPVAACVRAAAKGGSPLDEWARVRAEFDLEPSVINLDNGWSCTAPRSVYDVYERYARAINRLPARQQSVIGPTEGPRLYQALSTLLGVPIGEVAFTRNATESLGTVLLGYPLEAGDEIVCSTQDYWHMLHMIEARGANGAKVQRIDVPIPAPSPDAIVDAYAKAITPKTKLVLLTHVSNRTGQVMPVARIAEVAHRAGAEVVLDAAQSFAILDHHVPELNVDYYGTSLHKWLASPIASGALWMKPEHTKKIPPRFGAKLFPNEPPMFVYADVGTVCEAQFVAVGAAIEFHNRLGAARKEARVRELVAYLRAGLAKIPGIKFYTVDAAWASCGLLVFELPGKDPKQIQKQLWDQHKLLVQAQAPESVPAIRGVRVSPAIYTSMDDLDRAIDAIRRVA